LRVSFRFLSPLALVVAAPLLGLGGSARAGYLAPVSLVSRTPVGAFSDGLSQSNGDDGASAPASDESTPDINPPYDGSDPQSPSYGPAFAGLSPTYFGAGAGSPGPSFDSGPGSSSPMPGVVTRPETDAPALAGTLFLESADRRPPPFPSRIFRPPRRL
jgi:hypothetical protein